MPSAAPQASPYQRPWRSVTFVADPFSNFMVKCTKGSPVMAKLQGSWIWYELMAKDAAVAKTFYEAAVGWTVTPGTEAPLFYGHIARADGRQVGGMLPLSDDMIAQGAHTMWVGYIGVDDLDATLAQ
ncbi:hypothetical protein KXV85_005870, partial [Aspergillus fumigatus]